MAEGMRGRGHAWQRVCVAEGMRGRACEAWRVHGWGPVIVLLDYCIVLLMFNMCGTGCVWLGACVAGGV